MITYDIEDNRTNVWDANSVKDTYSYDALGRTISRTDPNDHIDNFKYSPAGLIAYTNQLDQWICYQLDAHGRKTARGRYRKPVL